MRMSRITVTVPPGGPSAPPCLERSGRRAPRPAPTDTPMTLTARHRTRSLAAVGLVLPLALLAACSTGGTDARPGSGDAAAAEEPAAAPREEATAVPRLAVTYDGGVQVLDATTLEVVGDLALDGFARLNPAGDGRHLLVSTTGGFRVLDAGTWAEPHGDHAHHYTADPTLTDVTYAAEKPGHVVVHDGRTALFDDGTGDVTVLDSAAVADPHGLDDARTLTTPSPHHGVAVELGDGPLVVAGAGSGPAPPRRRRAVRGRHRGRDRARPRRGGRPARPRRRAHAHRPEPAPRRRRRARRRLARRLRGHGGRAHGRAPPRRGGRGGRVERRVPRRARRGRRRGRGRRGRLRGRRARRRGRRDHQGREPGRLRAHRQPGGQRGVAGRPGRLQVGPRRRPGAADAGLARRHARREPAARRPARELHVPLARPR